VRPRDTERISTSKLHALRNPTMLGCGPWQAVRPRMSYAPDVVFFRGDRVHAINMRLPIRVPPDLAVEILSPATETTDRVRKLRTLATFGVREYWLIDPLGASVA
jgi:Uma2 family endonuclease